MSEDINNVVAMTDVLNELAHGFLLCVRPGILCLAVLVAYGEVSTFAGALFGVDYRYKCKYKKYIEREDETENKEENKDE